MTLIPEEVLNAAFKKLHDDGYAVIKGVLTKEECASARTRIHSFMREAGVDFNDPTLRRDNWANLNGIVEQPGIGHCQGAWEVRENARVAQVFEALHGDNDLLVSFDRVCVQPTNVRDTGAPLHTDQSHKRTGLLCIQSYINLSPALDEGTGTIALIPGGHKMHAQFARDHPELVESKDWKQYDPEHIKDWGEMIRVYADEGDMVVWDSRTPHRAHPPAKVLPAGIEAKERNVVYVCMEPRSVGPRKEIEKKKKAYNERRSTSHWPTKVRLFPGKVNTFRRPNLRATTMPRDDRTRSARQLELAGLTKLTTRAHSTKRPALPFVYKRAAQN